MRNILLLTAIAMLSFMGAASSQIITENGTDSAMKSYPGGADLTVVNGIRSGSATDVVLRWRVISSATSFGPGWDIVGSGVCDNNTCWNAVNPTNNLFNNDTVLQSNPYDNSAFPSGGSFGGSHDFHVIFTANNPPDGSSAVVRISATDINSMNSKTLTFIAYKGPLGITNLSSSDNIVLYPNPAREAVSVVYDPAYGIKTIALYNMIGKRMGPLYRPVSSGSAKIDLSDMPTGVYFMRLMDAQGHVVATRRFTRQ